MELRFLFVEDAEADVRLAMHHLRKAGIECTHLRVETESQLRDALREFKPDLILSDFTLPAFGGFDALAIAAAEAPHIPFIFVSGTIGEERAIEALKHGAVDYILKSNMARLGPAVQRALAQTAEHAARCKAEGRIRRLIYFDPLTGLAKRSLFCERLTRRLATYDPAVEPAAVVVFDVEHLGLINDSLGRFMGDLLLQCVADRLLRHFDDNECVAHLEGGTFAAWMPLIDGSEESVQCLPLQLTAIFSRPLIVAGRDIPVIVRCGMAPLPASGGDAQSLVQSAEAALHQAKNAGVQCLRHRPEMNSEFAQRLALEHRLRRALERDQFRLHYQPQIEQKSGRIVAVEGLLRWMDPENGLRLPAAFLPVLESTGLIVPVGEWVVQQAARDCRRWRQLGLPPLRVAVNVSPVQLSSLNFSSRLLSLAGPDTQPAYGLDIEITEEALLDEPQALLSTLSQLREAGVHIAIDDFGTGYSSLGRLSELPVDTLKIDQSFTRRLTGAPASQIVVSTIITLARSLGLDTVAEGVETLEQLEVLDDLGCTQSQGFLHSPAVPTEQLEQLLATEFRWAG